MIRVLVTGFEPFGGRSINPSGELARALDGRDLSGAHLVGRILPVSFTRLRGALEALWDEFKPDVVLLTGLAGAEPVLRLEQMAINAISPQVPDNDGLRPVDRRIEEGGPEGRRATMDLAAITQELLDQGIPARLSFHAGTHCCNASLYTMLGLIERAGRQVPCAFLHLPCLPAQVAADRKSGGPDGNSASMALETMVAGAEALLHRALVRRAQLVGTH